MLAERNSSSSPAPSGYASLRSTPPRGAGSRFSGRTHRSVDVSDRSEACIEVSEPPMRPDLLRHLTTGQD